MHATMLMLCYKIALFDRVKTPSVLAELGIEENSLRITLLYTVLLRAYHKIVVSAHILEINNHTIT